MALDRERREREERAREAELTLVRERREREERAREPELTLERQGREREERARETELTFTREKAALEERNLQLRLLLVEAENAANARAPLETDSVGIMNRGAAQQPICPRNILPLLDEKRADLAAYFRRFEVIARGQEWPKNKWATALFMIQMGVALKIFGRLPPEDRLNYEKSKEAFLQRFRFTAEGYRYIFRSSKPEDLKTGQ